jgi:hypothetical protein
MKFNIHKQIIIVFFIALIKDSNTDDKLRWAFEVFRHGARTPYSGMTADFKDCFGHQWNGIKELTGVGLRQHFLVGYRNRLKYINEKGLIKDTYDPREVFLISTDSNRTIMSANAQIQGLYPPGTGPSLSESQSNVAIPPADEESYKEEKEKLDNDNWAVLPNHINIMPVHSFFNQDHFIQLQDKKVCPHTKELYKKNEERKEVVDFLNNMDKKYSEKFAELFIEDQDPHSLKNYTKAYYIFDTIITEYTDGADRFEEIVEHCSVTKEELLKDAFDFFDLDLVGHGIDGDKDICIHAMSPIFDRLIQLMDLKIAKDMQGDEDYTEYDLPKFLMFSAHDSTCAAFMGFMKAVFDVEMRYPYFATNINIELYRKEKKDGKIEKSDYFVEYIINDESMKNFTYEEFVNTVNKNKKTFQQIKDFCKFDENQTVPQKDYSVIYLIVNIVLGVVSLILIVLLIITWRKGKNSSSGLEDISNNGPLTRLTDSNI